MHWLRTIESASNIRYKGGPLSVTLFMVRRRSWIHENVARFVPFSTSLALEDALLGEKWIRSLAKAGEVGLVAVGRAGAVTGIVAIPHKNVQSTIAPHWTLDGAVSLVSPGTMAFLCVPNGDLHVVLPNAGMFLRTQGRWHYVNYLAFRNLLRQHITSTIADSVLRMTLDLSYQRTGALLCFLDMTQDILRVVPDHGRNDRVNRAVRSAVRNLDIRKPMDRQVLLATAAIDGAIVFSQEGRVLDTACMIGEPDLASLSRAGTAQLERFPGARSTAAWNASIFGLSIKISEDGPVTIYRAGKLLGQMA
jgi:hypothetical protein